MLVACGGGGQTAKSTEPKEVGPAVDEKKAERDAKGLVTEIYETIDRGKTDSLFSLLTDPLIVFGPRKSDATSTRSDALVALGKLVDPKKKAHVSSGGLEVVASEGGHSAWAFDQVTFDGRSLVVMAVLTNTDDLWAVSAAAIADTPTGKQVKTQSKLDAIVPPGATAPAKVDPNAQGAVDAFEKGLTDQQTWGDDLASRSDAIVIGPTAGDVTHGKKDIKKLWKARTRSNVREAVNGEVTAQATPDGKLAWVTAPVTRAADDEDPTPMRVFAVFEKGAGGWKMIALHEAVAFDTPGAGAPFKKVIPPAPKPPEPPPKSDTATKKKTKKKKKKKTDDDS